MHPCPPQVLLEYPERGVAAKFNPQPADPATCQRWEPQPRSQGVYTSAVSSSLKELSRKTAANVCVHSQWNPSPEDRHCNPTNDVPNPWWLPADNTHRPQSIFIVFRLQCYISCLPLAPHIQCTWKQKSIILIPQCHHNYSFETAIENKLHLHCLFIRLLWVSNAHCSRQHFQC